MEKFRAESGPELSPREKFEVLLGMFGTEKAKEKFLKLCREYFIYKVAPVNENDSENYKADKKPKYSNPLLSRAHDHLKDVFTRLALEYKNPSAVHEQVLREFQSRTLLGEAVRAYIHSLDNMDDDEDVEKMRGRSDTAYFHSLGRET